MLFLATGDFDGFGGLSLALLVAAAVAAILWGLVTASLWVASRPKLPAAGPETPDLWDEPPAIASMLVQRWRVTRSAMAATLVDLAARRVLGLEDYAGGEHVVRIRSNRPEGEQFTRYEKQVLDLVRARATGNSCPVQVLDLGESGEARRWWKRFEKAVKQDAKARGLARGRWSRRDGTIIGGGLLIVMALVAAAFSVANVGNDEGSDRLNWFLWAGAGWLFVVFVLFKREALRETPVGREAAGRWLGTRNYLRSSETFDDLPPGAVTIWERHMAYAVAFGLAHATSRVLPFEEDDPNSAWSRRTGQWRKVQIDYPKSFGFGQKPLWVFLQGLGITAFFGFIGFYLLPVIGGLVWELGNDVIDENVTTTTDNDRAVLGLALGIGGVIALVGVILLYHLIRGLGRLILGALDLGRTIIIEGTVVNVYQGRAAIDDGVDDEVRALPAPPRGPVLRRGQEVRMTVSPRLYNVVKTEVLKSDATDLLDDEDEAPAILSMPAYSAPALDAGLASELTGLRLAADSEATVSPGGFGFHHFKDDTGGGLRVTATPFLGGAIGGAVLGFMMKRGDAAQVDVGGAQARWANERVLTVPSDRMLVVVDVDMPSLPPERRLEAARAIAGHYLGSVVEARAERAAEA